eukprot:RCo033735
MSTSFHPHTLHLTPPTRRVSLQALLGFTGSGFLVQPRVVQTFSSAPSPCEFPHNPFEGSNGHPLRFLSSSRSVCRACPGREPLCYGVTVLSPPHPHFLCPRKACSFLLTVFKKK